MTYKGILVAGGRGKLGSALGRLGANALGREALDVLSMQSISSALDKHAPKLVINCTAYTDVDRAESDAEAVFALNVGGAQRLAELCAERHIPLIHISTDCVFGDGSPDMPVTEDAPMAPLSVYGQSKRDSEVAALEAGGRVCIGRVSWLFDHGPQSFIGKMLAIAQGRETMQIVDDAYGRPTEVGALAERLLKLAELMAGGRDVPSILHFGPPEPVNRFEWAEAVFAASAARGGPAPVLSPCSSDTFNEVARRPRGLVLDTQLADDLLGPFPDWRPSSDAAVAQLVRSMAGPT